MAEESTHVLIFGKPGCPKCKLLRRRVGKVLNQDKYRELEENYCSLDTEKGLVLFSKAGCINPSRIPALLMARKDAETSRFVPIPVSESSREDSVCGKSRLYSWIGLQTDYKTGAGVISPKMIRSVFDEAMSA